MAVLNDIKQKQKTDVKHGAKTMNSHTNPYIIAFLVVRPFLTLVPLHREV